MGCEWVGAGGEQQRGFGVYRSVRQRKTLLARVPPTLGRARQSCEQREFCPSTRSTSANLCTTQGIMNHGLWGAGAEGRSAHSPNVYSTIRCSTARGTGTGEACAKPLRSSSAKCWRLTAPQTHAQARRRDEEVCAIHTAWHKQTYNWCGLAPHSGSTRQRTLLALPR